MDHESRMRLIDQLETEMLEWLSGHRSHTNQIHYFGPQTDGLIAQLDFYEVAKRAMAIEALATVDAAP